jgi:hypothetical protein
MKYLFTTLAIGQNYFNTAKQFSLDLYNKDQEFSRIIVSDIEDFNIPNTQTIKPPPNMVYSIRNHFNYNLKYLAIEEACKADVNYIIYADADWQIHDLYTKNKLLSFLELLNNSHYDFIYERPHLVGASKHNLAKCFWKHKIEPYKLMLTNKYDQAHVVNEQFLVFKNNNKLKIFIDKWKERNEFGIQNNIWAFAEGLEIGMSAIDANMTMNWQLMRSLKQCFRFQNNTGISFERF